MAAGSFYGRRTYKTDCKTGDGLFEKHEKNQHSIKERRSL
jgi:hypothetical protein